jgi:lipid A 3-O-deacylase
MGLARVSGSVSLLWAALAGAASPATAADNVASILDRAAIGYFAHDVADLWSGDRFERAVASFNVDLTFAPSLAVPLGTIHPALGGSVALGTGTDFGYADGRYEIRGPFNTFLVLGLGLAIHDGALTPGRPVLAKGDHDLKALGSRVLFHVPVELGVMLGDRFTVSVYFEHISNGGIGAHFNEGLDNLGGRVGYKF